MSNKRLPSIVLSSLLQVLLNDEQLLSLSKLNISHLTLDSREVCQGSLFVALNGAQTDGRRFCNKAIELGASAILSELECSDNHIEWHQTGVPIIHVSQLSSHLSHIASIFYQRPQDNLILLGITGTNGKTTVTQLICQWLTLLGKKAYSMGTLGNGLIDDLKPSQNTTLNAIDLIKHLAIARDANAQYLVMEVSSHGLSLDRLKSLHFAVAAFTNLSQDHLDFHGDMASYASAKQQLFTTKYCDKAVLNGSDKVAQAWNEQWPSEIELSAFNQPLTNAKHYMLANNVHFDHSGISADIESSFGQGILNSSLLGQFNLDNLLTALNTLCLAGFDFEKLVHLAPTLQAVPGRMEVFSNQNSPTVVVDYAHTPDALEKALLALRLHCQGKLSVVFGCGGDRDNSKRALMAKAAEQFADTVYFTQDNSRSESAQQIFNDMLSGISQPERITIEADRTTAIELALSHSTSQDMILLAGKGHEDYQILNGQTVDYDERALAKKLVQAYL